MRKCLRRYASSHKKHRIRAMLDKLESLDREQHGIARADISSEPPPTVDEILEWYR